MKFSPAEGEPVAPGKVYVHTGRPTKYDPKYCQAIQEFCGLKAGNTLSAFALSIGVTHETINEWARVHPEFSSAKRAAKAAQEQKMFDLGMKGMKGHNGQGAWQAAWIFAMKARFGWREEGPTDQEEESDLEFTE